MFFSLTNFECLSNMRSENITLIVNFVYSCVVFFLTLQIIPRLIDMFLKAKIFGIDVHKINQPAVPEAFGVVIGCMYLITLFLFIPVPFSRYILDTENFPHNQFVEVLAALLSICCMLLLGFADDVLDLKWRHKLFLPTVASLPLLAVYYINTSSTIIIVPKPFRNLFGLSLNLGIAYYVYMGMLAVFCTNAINILSGVNGLEVGQSVIIGSSIITFNLLELYGFSTRTHVFSLYFMMPFVAVSVAILIYNWYPAKVFPGDTYCYFAGMTFAVVGIFGHFSKTVLLFFMPQIFNFIYSLPQLFHLLPCPRHRMPKVNYNGLLEPSYAVVQLNQLPFLGKLSLKILQTFKLIEMQTLNETCVRFNNLTIINLILLFSGPLHEESVTIWLLLIQIVGSMIAFIIRYPLASLFYDV